MDKLKVYLAGGMKTGWQDIIIPLLPDCEIFDPRTHGLHEAYKYTWWDLGHVALADVVVAYMDSANPSGFGMSIEVGYAHALGKKLIFVDALDDTDSRSPAFNMHRVMCTVVGSLQTAALLVKALEATGYGRRKGE